MILGGAGRVRLRCYVGRSAAAKRGARVLQAAAVFSIAIARPNSSGRAISPARLSAPRNASHHVTLPFVRKAAVLGAGVMGAQIAAHLANAGIPVLLFDLPAKEGDPERPRRPRPSRTSPSSNPRRWRPRIAQRRSKPPTTAATWRASRECDLVIEAIAERLDWKRDLYEKIAPHLAPRRGPGVEHVGPVAGRAVGRRCRERVRAALLRRALLQPAAVHASGRADRRRRRPTPALLDALEAFLTTTLGKGVIRASDTPNFIANRIGIFSMLATMKHTQTFGLAVRRRRRADRSRDRPREERDLSHRRRRRPRHDGARRQDDVRHAARRSVARAVRHAARAGRRWSRRARWAPRRRPGFFRKVGKDIEVLDPAARAYRTAAGEVAPEVAELLKIRAPAEKFAKLRASARIRRRSSCGRSSAISSTTARTTSREIADNARDVDLAIRWGFGWQMGPFETWQAAGWNDVARLDRARTSPRARRSPSVPLPAWVRGDEGARRARRARAAGRVLAGARRVRAARSTLPVYRRQLVSRSRAGRAPADAGTTIFETDARAHVAPGRRRRHRVVQDQGATRSARTCSTASCARSTRPSGSAPAS